MRRVGDSRQFRIVRAWSRVEDYIFDPKRLVASAAAFVLAYLVVSIVWLWDGFRSVDFTAFWAASWLVLNDAPSAVYDDTKIAYAHSFAIPAGTYFYQWLYPPTFLVVVLPLALMPYALSYFVWVALTFGVYASLLSKIAAARWPLLASLAFPGALMNMLTGQNGFFLTSLFAAAFYTLERHPIWSGVFIGLISVKPQLGILWPIALICGRHWLALASAGCTTVFLVLLTAINFGPELWHAFIDRVMLVQSGLDAGLVSWIKIPTLYGSARLLGFDSELAYLLHFLLAVYVVITTGYIWFKQPSLPLRVSVLTIGTMLVLPRLLFYDYALLAIPLTLLILEGIQTGWRRYERPVLLLAWLSPLLGLVVAIAIHIHLSPFILLGLFVLAVGRCISSPGPARVSANRPISSSTQR